jgi:hypothetical protein
VIRHHNSKKPYILSYAAHYYAIFCSFLRLSSPWAQGKNNMRTQLILGAGSCTRCYFVISVVMTTAAKYSSSNFTRFSIFHSICLSSSKMTMQTHSIDFNTGWGHIFPSVSCLHATVEPDVTAYITRPSREILISVPVKVAITITERYWTVTEHLHSLIPTLHKCCHEDTNSDLSWYFFKRQNNNHHLFIK